MIRTATMTTVTATTGAFTLALMLTLGIVNGVQAESESEATAPEPAKVIAVNLYADWCGLCERKGPALESAMERLAAASVLFVTADFTDDQSTQQARFLISALADENVWEHIEGTGSVVLLDGETREKVGRLTANMDADEMTAMIEQAIGDEEAG